MVIEEVSAIQEDLEIERTCRESAEALASKVQFIPTILLLALLAHHPFILFIVYFAKIRNVVIRVS